MTKWMKYTGAPEQIDEMRKSNNGYLLRHLNGGESIIYKHDDLFLNRNDIAWYLIRQPHQYADMICQWAKTGQPVFARAKNSHEPAVLCHGYFPPFAHPKEFEYSFTPFDE
jgi:hypothetical protein